jgi:uncharacterized repeat protein (TIGR03803 family)
MRKPRTIESSLLSSTSETSRWATVCSLQSVCVLFFFLIGLTSARAQTFTSLLSFDGTDGAFPQGALVEGADGNLYGTAPFGGAHGAGTVFKVTPDGKLTTIHSFDYTDGEAPYTGVIRGRNGNFYGVTSFAGRNEYGTVFEVTPEGKLTTLYNFCSVFNCVDGATPYAGLVEGRDGNLYGTTYAGGAAGAGTIFKLTPDGTLSTLHNFCSYLDCADGTAPLTASLLEASNGNFYGTTPMGGGLRVGTVFEITPDGDFTTLHNFCSLSNCVDGANPEGTLIEGRNGNLYGTTSSGALGGGTVFEITPEGKLTTLYKFCSQPNCADGAGPDGGLVQGRNGNFYGTTYTGAETSYGYGGRIFEITPEGKLRTLHVFCSERGCIDGRAPVAGLTRAKCGIFYGTTFEGGVYGTSQCGVYGDYGCGTLFKLDLDKESKRTSDGPIEGDIP